MITWKIEWMNVSTSLINGFQEVVLTAGWRCDAKKGDALVSSYGSVSFPQPSVEGQFTPYNQLTEDDVLGWTWANGIDKTEVESTLTNELNDVLNPPVKTPTLPWAL